MSEQEIRDRLQELGREIYLLLRQSENRTYNAVFIDEGTGERLTLLTLHEPDKS